MKEAIPPETLPISGWNVTVYKPGETKATFDGILEFFSGGRLSYVLPTWTLNIPGVGGTPPFDLTTSIGDVHDYPVSLYHPDEKLTCHGTATLGNTEELMGQGPLFWGAFGEDQG